MLPEHIWRRRHQTIVALVWLHAAGLFAFGLSQGRPVGHMLVDIAPILVAAYVAGSEAMSMKLRVAAASFGLVTCSAVLVHLWDGVIEAHFHFFVVIGILTLYQDWMPFLRRDRLRRRPPRRHGRARAGQRLQPPRRGRAPVELGGHPRRLRARRQRRAHRRLAHERDPAAARPAHRPAEPRCCSSTA